mgnify:CR=1 FL=1
MKILYVSQYFYPETFRGNDYVGQMWLELKNLNESLKQYKE